MKPSDVVLGVPPLCGTMGRAELEHAAALIVRTCAVLGDAWRPVAPKDVGIVLNTDVLGHVEPFAKLIENPFFKPDFFALAESEFARWTAEPKGPMELTEAGLAAITKWVRPPADEPRTKRVAACLECDHCGAEAVESETGLFYEGDATCCQTCGMPGHITVDEGRCSGGCSEDDCTCGTASWVCHDDEQCTRPDCEDCAEHRKEALDA